MDKTDLIDIETHILRLEMCVLENVLMLRVNIFKCRCQIKWLVINKNREQLKTYVLFTL